MAAPFYGTLVYNCVQSTGRSWLQGLEFLKNLQYLSKCIGLMEEREEELKGLLIKHKEESEKPGLKHNIKKTKVMAPGPVTW